MSHTAPPLRCTHRSPSCTASGPWYLVVSYLPPTYEFPAHSMGVGAATSDEEGGAGTTWDRASKAEWVRHEVPEMRSGYILDVRCYTSKLRTRSRRSPLAAQVTHKSLLRDSNFLVPSCLFFLHQAFALHLRKQLRLRKRKFTSVLRN